MIYGDVSSAEVTRDAAAAAMSSLLCGYVDGEAVGWLQGCFCVDFQASRTRRLISEQLRLY